MLTPAELDTLAELLLPQSVEHRGTRYEFTPTLVEKIFGDGKQLLMLFPIMERPRYWIVRVDSTCTDDEELHEILDDIYDAIDEQFGPPDEDDLGVGDERPYFPKHDSQGVSWHFVRREK